MKMGRPPLPLAVRVKFWEGIEAGWSVSAAAGAAGCSESVGRWWLKQAGGVKPRLVRRGD